MFWLIVLILLCVYVPTIGIPILIFLGVVWAANAIFGLSIMGISWGLRKKEEKKEKVAKNKELDERHKKRLEFWKSLLERCKAKTQLHSNISPCINAWISAGAGRNGIGYSYTITKKHGTVEVYINRGKDSEVENKKIFDQLNSHRKEIESIFGGDLEWQGLDDRKAARVRKVYSGIGLNDKESWGRLQGDMIDGMVRLEKAFRKHIASLEI
jgi:hypothetical protein